MIAARASLASLACALAVGCGGRDPTSLPGAPEAPRKDDPASSVGCDAGDAAFVQEATLALLGRRPLSQAEIDVGAQLIAKIDAQRASASDDAASSTNDASAGARADHPGRRAFVRSLVGDSAYVERWSAHVMDSLFVTRTGTQQLSDCYAPSATDPSDPALAEAVRDQGSEDGPASTEPFTYGDLLRSSLALDDVSPIYRAQLFAMMTRPNPCGNVDAVKQELAFREEIGDAFDAAFLDRDPVCLACHNSEASVTDREEPAEDRHWPVAGSLEAAVFGSSFEVDPAVAHGAFRVTDFLGAGGPQIDLEADLAYCYDGDFASSSCNGGQVDNCGDGFPPFCFNYVSQPFCAPDAEDGASAQCDDVPVCIDPTFTEGEFAFCDTGAITCGTGKDDWYLFCADDAVAPSCDGDGVPFCPQAPGEGEGEGEPQVDGLLPWGADPVCGVFNPNVQDDIADVDARFASALGKRATVLDVEKALRRGVDSLAARGLVLRDDGSVDGADEALAYLVAMHVVDGVWREIQGAPLTIATHFPRNAASRDRLQSLTDHFVRSHWSLGALLEDVLLDSTFNLPAPSAACGDAYGLPAVFDPWVLAEPDENMRNNSSADGVHALSARVLLSSAQAALAWGAPDDEPFPDPSMFGSDEADFQRGIGVFHGISEKGQRGLDFQARLTWESRYGSCANPSAAPDFIADLASRAASSHASLHDAIGALKERIVNEPAIDDTESALLTERFGDLSAEVASAADADGTLRAVCGALLESPQFLLGGLSNDLGERATLSTSLEDACEALRDRGVSGVTIDCDASGVK